MKSVDFCTSWKFRKAGADDYKIVNLPHDATLYEGRSPNSPGEGAYGWFLGGVYEYEKTFSVPEEWRDMVATLQFGGVYKDSIVYINGQQVGGCVYGYSEFAVSMENYLNIGEDNVVKVVVDNSNLPNSRWYAGAGIYRPVTLLLGGQKHILRRGVKISTVSISPVTIRIETSCTGGNVFVEILDNGKTIAKAEGENVEIAIPDGKLWSDESPNLYQCRVSLFDNNELADQVTETFGIRELSWSNKGFFVNGKETLLRGGCVHSDNGILGACSYQEAEDRRVKRLKQTGFNAIRVSHNPASESMLYACDKYGMYVIDETWDMWYSPKSKQDYGKDFEANYMYDVEALVKRDYNHPSVIMYSIGNEMSEPAKEKGVSLTKKLVDDFHKLDSTRPVTAGVNLFVISRSAKGNPIYKEDGGRNSQEKDMSKMNSTLFNMMTSIVGTGMNKSSNSKKADMITKPCLDALDIAGYNYTSGRYPLEAKANPNRVIVGSETFPQTIVKNWAMVEKYPYLIGDFMWTAWDYLGEAGIGTWAYHADGKSFNKPYPWILADTGAFDILGDPNGEAFLAQTVWGFSDKPIIAVRPINHATKPAKAVWRGTNSIPSWSWRGCEGRKAIVEVYSNAYRIELKLNGKSLGKKRVKDFTATFKVKYAPGELEAIAYDSSMQVKNQSTISSATGRTKISICPEQNTASMDEIVYVPISIVGENNIVESNADIALSVTVEGGELLGFGSANPRTEDDYTKGKFTTFYGKSLAVVKAKNAGKMIVRVSGADLETATLEIPIKANTGL